MEALLVQLIMSLVQAIPSMVDAIQKSQTLNDEEKKKLLLELNIQLSAATVKVQQVRFREVGIVPPAP